MLFKNIFILKNQCFLFSSILCILVSGYLMYTMSALSEVLLSSLKSLSFIQSQINLVIYFRISWSVLFLVKSDVLLFSKSLLALLCFFSKVCSFTNFIF